MPQVAEFEIEGNPGALLTGPHDDWESADSTLLLEELIHGGSIAQLTITAQPHDDGLRVSTSTELTKGDCAALGAKLLHYAATLEPEATL